jgi:hypothetical protein
VTATNLRQQFHAKQGEYQLMNLIFSAMHAQQESKQWPPFGTVWFTQSLLSTTNFC